MKARPSPRAASVARPRSENGAPAGTTPSERSGERDAARQEFAPSDEQIERALGRLHRALFKYPMAVQAAFSALVAEGRRFAQTPEGSEWKERLSRAEETGRARMLWEVLSLSSFTEHNDNPLPTVMVDTLVHTIRTKKLEPLLSKLFERRFGR